MVVVRTTRTIFLERVSCLCGNTLMSYHIGGCMVVVPEICSCVWEKTKNHRGIL